MKATLSSCVPALLVGLSCVGLQAPTALGRESLKEEFHQTYPLSSQGKFSLDTVNGKVHISTWARSEVQVDAIKRADTQADLDGLKIEVESKPDAIRIHTKYPKTSGSGKWWRIKSKAPDVDYDIKVPVQVSLRDVQSVNGSLQLEGVQGRVHASTVNGRLTAKGLAGDARLETVNGTIEAGFDGFKDVRSVSVKSVNGKIALTLPEQADAKVTGSTLNGRIKAEAPLTAKRNWPIGSELHKNLGNGSAAVHLETVNGAIEVKGAKPGPSVLLEQPE